MRNSINEAFLSSLKDDIAGDPMNEQIRWTHLTHEQIRQRLINQFDIRISVPVVKKLLKKHGFKRRKAQKKQTLKQVPGRDQQFNYIAELRAKYQQTGNPIISMDTKKKEMIGNFYREIGRAHV